ncbi:AHH domain-containing protein [Flavobacterium crocinum]|nr:AHH domain-containing protein [Flavobacterium crocinum]
MYLILFTSLFSSCSVEENIISNETIHSSNYSLKTITRDEIDLNTKIVAKLQKYNSQQNNITSKNVPIDNLGLTIQTDNANYIKNGNYHSYTFSTVQNETDNIKNILFSLTENGEYDAFLVEYGFNKIELNSFDSKNKPGSAKITPINLDISSVTAKTASLWVCKYNYELVSSGDLVGAENVIYSWVLVTSDCTVINANVIDDDTSTTNYGSGTASYTSNGYMNPTAGGGSSIATSPLFAMYDEPEILKIETVKKYLNVGGQQKRFLEQNGEIAFAFYDYLVANRFTDASKSFGKELLEIIRTDTSFDLNALYFTLNAQSKNKINNGLDETFLLAIDQYMDADMTNIYNTDPDLMIYFGAHHIVKMARLKKLNPQWSYLKCYWEASKEVVHITLDVFGTVPVIGELADVTNGVLYVIEGDGLNATISIASAVPIAGWAAVSTKYAIKINEVYSIGTKVKLVWKVSGDLITFGSRSQLRKVLGLAVGDLRQAHHIIPWNKLLEPAIQKAAKSQHAFHMNEALNGIPLDKAIHSGSHPHYDSLIQARLNAIPANATPDQAYAKVLDLINDVKDAIKNNPNVPLNQLIF